MEYACIAALEDRKTRCRRLVEWPEKFCWQHPEGAEIAPPPDIVLLKPKVNPHWFGLLAKEIRQLPAGRKEEKIKQHIAQAECLGRDAFALRQGIEDSGSPVFGKKGAEFVNPSNLLQEFLEEGYLLTNIHGRPARNQPMWILIMGFSRQIERIDSSLLKLMESDLAKAVLGVILGSVWYYCHIWANPPDEKGRIVHTVNLAHRHPPETPAKKLRFAKGLWALE